MGRVPELLPDNEGGKGLLMQSNPLKRWEWQIFPLPSQSVLGVGGGCAIPSHIIRRGLGEGGGGGGKIPSIASITERKLSPVNAGKPAFLLRGSQAFGTLTCK